MDREGPRLRKVYKEINISFQIHDYTLLSVHHTILANVLKTVVCLADYTDLREKLNHLTNLLTNQIRPRCASVPSGK